MSGAQANPNPTPSSSTANPAATGASSSSGANQPSPATPRAEPKAPPANVSANPTTDARLRAGAEESGSLEWPFNLVPANQLRPDRCPPGSTVVLKQLAYELTEREVLVLANSCGGKFADNCNAVSACCFMYEQGNVVTPKGTAMFTYASPSLANFAITQLNGKVVIGRRVQAEIAHCANLRLSQMGSIHLGLHVVLHLAN